MNMKVLVQSFGYKKLKAAVMADCAKGDNCFNPMGCTKRKGPRKCHSQYCSMFKHAIDLAKHYEHKIGATTHDLLNAWESRRNYWYMNFYNNEIPRLDTSDILIIESKADFPDIAKDGFICPRCGGVSTDPQECNSGKLMDPINICNWKSYGLFRTLGKGITLFILEDYSSRGIFKPVNYKGSTVR